MSSVAREIMTGPVFRIQARTPILKAVCLMSDAGEDGAVVYDDRARIVGALSLFDILLGALRIPRPIAGFYRYCHPTIRPNDEWPFFDAWESVAQESLDDLTLQDVLCPEIISVPEDEPLLEVAERMDRSRLHRIFVSKRDQPVGLISIFDLCRALIPDPVPLIA